MYVYPNTNIKILHNIPLDNSYRNTLYWSTKQAQTEYFTGKVKHNFVNCTYQRANSNLIKVGIKVEDLYDCNYLMFQNESFGNKWFYAFILEVNYVNNDVAEIKYEIDVMQTWFFDYSLEQCFIERQHTTSDNIGEHIIDEGLATGETVISNVVNSNDVIGVLKQVLSVNGLSVANITPTGLNPYPEGHNFSTNGIKSDKQYIAFNINTDITPLEQLEKSGQLQAVSDLFVYPAELLSYEDVEYTPRGVRVTGGNSIIWDCGTTPSTINGYTPKNNKLFTFPYCFMEMFSCGGGNNIYKYEYFTNNNVKFQLQGACSEDTIVQAVPMNYKGYSFNINEMTECNNYPHIPITTNTFDNYLARKSTSMIASNIFSVLNAGTSLATGNVSGFVNSGNTIAKNLIETTNPTRITPTISGDMTGIITRLYNNCGFRLLKRTITADYAKSIDQFFTMYGYKINRVQTPNLKARPHYTYVKTSGCQIKGECPQDDIFKIENIFDNGITFWINPSEVGDYSVDNSPT